MNIGKFEKKKISVSTVEYENIAGLGSRTRVCLKIATSTEYKCHPPSHMLYDSYIPFLIKILSGKIV